jgi:hypothetical protein
LRCAAVADQATLEAARPDFDVLVREPVPFGWTLEAMAIVDAYYLAETAEAQPLVPPLDDAERELWRWRAEYLEVSKRLLVLAGRVRNVTALDYPTAIGRVLSEEVSAFAPAPPSSTGAPHFEAIELDASREALHRQLVIWIDLLIARARRGDGTFPGVLPDTASAPHLRDPHLGSRMRWTRFPGRRSGRLSCVGHDGRLAPDPTGTDDVATEVHPTRIAWSDLR